MDNAFATHIDTNGLPVAFPDMRPGEQPTAFHPTPCCGASATYFEATLGCKRCYGEVEDWYGDVPRGPFEIIEDRVPGAGFDNVEELTASLHGLASKPHPCYPATLALTVDTRADSSRRGFLCIADIADPTRHVYTSFASIADRDALDVAADALERCRELGAMRCVDAAGADIEVADLIASIQADHPSHRVLDGPGSYVLPPGNTAGTYRDLDGRLWRAQSMYMPFTLNDEQAGREGDWIARDVTDSEQGGPVVLIEAERFEIEFTRETPGMR
jgi:hypothetical protein